METYVMHLSDAGNADYQLSVKATAQSLAQAAHDAIDQFMKMYDGGISLPLFIDIHPASDFQGRAWMHAQEAALHS